MTTMIKNTILTVLLGVFAVSCVSLDTPPYDRETDLTYWEEDPNAAINALNSCYTYLASMDEQVYSEAMTDNAYIKMPLGYTQSIGNGSYSTADGYVSTVWNARYTGIRLCNELLNNIDRVPGLDAELKKRYIGEALVIRAWHYYELYTRFGAVPYTTKVISIEESKTIGRTAKATVISNILSDLEDVIDGKWLPKSYTGDNRGRITHWAAVAVKAKINLFEGNWSEVKNLTSDIMTEGGFDLFGNYAGLFEAANEYNIEVIMDAQYRPASREHGVQYNFLPPSMGGYSLIAPLQELVDSYITINGKAISEEGSGYNAGKPYDNRDPRLRATVMYSGNSYVTADGAEKVIDCVNGSQDGIDKESNSTVTGYYIKKWWDKTYRENHNSGLNPIIIRYADILLMHAEAAAELEQLDQATWNSTIRKIRTRAGFTAASALDFPSSADKETLIGIVRNERRSELALEGHRFKDIIRWRIAEDVLNGWCHGIKTGADTDLDGGYKRIENRKFDSKKHYLWPIPQSERDLNSNLDQNPNW